jgi:hypothetical protein
MITLILTKEKDLPFLNGPWLCDKLGNLLKLLRAILLEKIIVKHCAFRR